MPHTLGFAKRIFVHLKMSRFAGTTYRPTARSKSYPFQCPQGINYEHVWCLHFQWECTTIVYAGFGGNSLGQNQEDATAFQGYPGVS